MAEKTEDHPTWPDRLTKWAVRLTGGVFVALMLAGWIYAGLWLLAPKLGDWVSGWVVSQDVSAVEWIMLGLLVYIAAKVTDILGELRRR